MPTSKSRDLPPRLRPVLLELVKGETNADIAEALALELHTVESYVSELLSCFDCRNRTELAVRALRGEFGDLERF